jgi:hypothetical protein
MRRRTVSMFRLSAKAPDEVAVLSRLRVGMAIHVAVLGLSVALFALDAASP